jgi:ribonuclease HI
MSGPLPGERQTNQRAELLAIQRAFEVAPKSHHIRVITDSRYAISCITDWSKRWKLNDWKTAEGKSVENKDLIEPIIKLVDERSLLGVETRFVWTKGHAGNEGNEAADKLAVAGALLPQDSHIVVHAEVELDGQSEGVLDDELGTDPEPVPHEEDVDATFETALQEVVREDAGRPRDEVPESSQTTRAEERVAVDVVDNGESVTVEDATERREATAEL